MITIRDETSDDLEMVQSLVFEAFKASPMGHQGEAELVATLRQSTDQKLSIVACRGSSVVGHAMFTQATVHWKDRVEQGMGLAPLSVSPQYQSQRIGSKLVEFGLRRVFESDMAFVIVLGHPKYYSRFGFQRAHEFGVCHGFAEIPQDNFFIKWNPQLPIRRCTDMGLAYYDMKFGTQHAVIPPRMGSN